MDLFCKVFFYIAQDTAIMYYLVEGSKNPIGLCNLHGCDARIFCYTSGEAAILPLCLMSKSKEEHDYGRNSKTRAIVIRVKPFTAITTIIWPDNAIKKQNKSL
jgi:hypothetical protein